VGLRKTVVLGLILLVCGLPVTLWTAGFRTKVDLNSPTVVAETDQPTGNWAVSALFTTGERLIFVIKDGDGWGWYASEPNPGSPSTFQSLYIDVSIIDPKGGKTNFTIVFEEATSETAVTPLLSFFAGNLTHNDGGLTMEPEDIWVANNQSVYYNYAKEGIGGVGGIVNYDGNYTVVVDKASFGGSSTPPKYLKLYEQGVSTESPYMFVVPVGVAIMVSGTALSVWAWRQPKRRVKQSARSSCRYQSVKPGVVFFSHLRSPYS
jgi:hypothetical protein